jgi:hypothetical protein
LSAFLVFAGMGSYWSSSLAKLQSRKQALKISVFSIVFISLGYLFLLPPVFDVLMPAPISIKIFTTTLLIAPLAFFMGMPLPLAMESLSQNEQSLIPWAWGINGCASVISAVLATLLAIHFGFTMVIVLAILLYICTLFIFPEVPTPKI